MQPNPNLPSLVKKLNVPKVMLTEAAAFRMVDDALYKARDEQANMINERNAEAQLLKYKNKKFRKIIINLKQDKDRLEVDCDKYLDRIDRLKDALRSRTLEFNDLQLKLMDMQTFTETLKLKLAKSQRPTSSRSRPSSRGSRRSRSPPRSRPVSASVIEAPPDQELIHNVRPKSAGSLSTRSSSVVSSSRASSASSIRPQSAGAKPMSRPSSGERRVAFAESDSEDDQDVQGSILSPVKEVREEEEDDDHPEAKEEKEDGEKSSSDDGEKSEKDSSEEDSSEDDEEGKTKKDPKRDSAEEEDKEVLSEQRVKEIEEFHKMGGGRPSTPGDQADARPYTASPRLMQAELKKEVDYLLEDDDPRPKTAPEPTTVQMGKKKRIAFPKRKPKRVAKVKEKVTQKKKKRFDDDLSPLELIEKYPEPDMRDELEDLYKLWGGKRWKLLLTVHGIDCLDNKMKRHACSGVTAVCVFVFGLLRLILTLDVAGAPQAVWEAFILMFAGYCQYAMGEVLFRDKLLKRLIVFQLRHRESQFYGQRRFTRCIYYGQGAGLVISLLYNASWLSVGTATATMDSTTWASLGMLTVIFFLYIVQIVWHTIGLYVYMQISLAMYVMHHATLDRELAGEHVTTFYKVRCMVDSSSKILGKWIYSPAVVTSLIGALISTYSMTNIDVLEKSNLLQFCGVFINGVILFICVYLGGQTTESCFQICKRLTQAYLTYCQDKQKELVTKARFAGAGGGLDENGEAGFSKVDKHNKFPLTLYELSLQYHANSNNFIYSYMSNHSEMGFRALGVIVRQWHGIMLGVVLLAVMIAGPGA